MPEFPSHTHTWLWREICGLRENELELFLASTRSPTPKDYAKHAFVSEVEGKIFYAWPGTMREVLLFPISFVLMHPRRLAACLRYAICIQRDGGASFAKVVALMFPAWRLAQWCTRNGIRHVHVATPSNSIIVAQLAAIFAELTTDVTINANLEWWGGAMREKLARCERVFVVAQWMKDQIEREYPKTIAAKTLLARHGVDTLAWKPGRAKKRMNGPVKIVSVGRLHPTKGHDDLLRAVGILVARGHQVQLEIAGAGPQESELRRLINDLGLSNIAKLVGPLAESEVRDLLGNADVFVAASHAEPLGVVYMEAMAAGVPVIGTNAGGAPEIIEDGRSGLLVAPQDPEDLACALERLCFDQELRDRLASNALTKVRAVFDSRIGAKVVSDEIIGILRGLGNSRLK